MVGAAVREVLSVNELRQLAAVEVQVVADDGRCQRPRVSQSSPNLELGGAYIPEGVHRRRYSSAVGALVSLASKLLCARDSVARSPGARSDGSRDVRIANS